MIKGFLAFLFVFQILFPLESNAAIMKAMNFTQEGEVSKLEMIFDENEVSAKKFHVTEDKQIIIDLKDTAATERVMRAFDTSEFTGSVVFISAYKKPNIEKDLRIAIQLRDNVRSVIKRRPNRVVLEIEGRFGVFNKGQIDEFNKFEEETGENIVEARGLLVPKSDSVEDILENLTLSGRKKYIGRKISINVKNVRVEEVLKMIADASGFNIIITQEVTAGVPPMTLNLTNIPWDQALDTILGLNKLVARKNGIILMVTTLKKATEDQKAEAEARAVKIKEEPLVTKVFPISYAATGDMEKILKEYQTKERGSMSVDVRTNSIIVRDTPEIIEKMKKIIVALDTQTPQVLIESKIVEVTETYAKEIGLVQGFNFSYDPIGAQASDSQSTVGTTPPDTSEGGPGFSFSSAPSFGDDGRTLFGLTVGRFNRLFNLNFALQLMENESKAKIVASPKVITQNKKQATLTTTDQTSYPQTSTDETTGDVTDSFAQIDAKLTLDVTPQVTNEGSISLQVNLSRDQFGVRPAPGAPPDKQNRSVKTTVLVENGSTIVVGGIYFLEKRESHSGIPFLKDIPLIGWLFRTPHAPTTSKTEMIIFLTPRIINQEEAGLLDTQT